MSKSYAASSVASVPKAAKPKMLSLICKAIEVTGVPRKGSSYLGIRNWIVHNLDTEMKNSRLTVLLKKAFDAGLEQKVLCRPGKYKDIVGLRGWFALEKNSQKEEKRDKKSLSKVPKTNIEKITKPLGKLAVGKSGARKSFFTFAKQSVAATESAPKVAKSKVAATKSAPSVAKSKIAAAKSAPSVAKSKVAAAKSAPSVAKSKVAAAKSAPIVAKSKVAAAKSAPSVAKSKVAAAKSAPIAAKSKVSAAESAPSVAKSKVAAAKSATRKIKTLKVATTSNTEEYLSEVETAPTDTESETSPKRKRPQDTETDAETESSDMSKQVKKTAKVRPRIKTAKSKIPEDAKVKNLGSSEDESSSDDFPRKDLSDTELEVKPLGRKSLKSYASDTDISICYKVPKRKMKK